MILPIIAYGDTILRKRCDNINKDYPALKQLIADMFETMNNAKGVGLAAPQIGLSIRLFIVDASGFAEDNDKYKYLIGFRKVFINPVLLDESGKPWSYEEGCLSIPAIREKVERPEKAHIRFLDENFVEHIESFDGMKARVIQHEYDHIEGVLFVDHLNALKKKLIKRRLNDISAGNVNVNYKMKFPVRKR